MIQNIVAKNGALRIAISNKSCTPYWRIDCEEIETIASAEDLGAGFNFSFFGGPTGINLRINFVHGDRR